MNRINLIMAGLFVLSIMSFVLIEKATAYRVSSLVYLVLVGAYGIFLRRNDVFAASTLFFSLYSVNQYLFVELLPAWISIASASLLVLILWWIAYRNEGWPVAIAISILVCELSIVSQYTVLDNRWQAYIVTLPFLLAFQQNATDFRPNNSEVT